MPGSTPDVPAWIITLGKPPAWWAELEQLPYARRVATLALAMQECPECQDLMASNVATEAELLELEARLYHATYDLVRVRLEADETPALIEAEVIECDVPPSTPAMMLALDDTLAGRPRRYPMPGPEPDRVTDDGRQR